MKPARLTKYSDSFPAGSLVIVRAADPTHNYLGRVKRPTWRTNVPTPDWRIVEEVATGGGLCIHIDNLQSA